MISLKEELDKITPVEGTCGCGRVSYKEYNERFYWCSGCKQVNWECSYRSEDE